MEQMCTQPPWPLDEAEESPAGGQQDGSQQVHTVMEEMQLRKQR